MRFEPTDEQRGFATALDDLLRAADTPAAVRAWGLGEPERGLALWAQLAQMGVAGLLVSESAGGLGASHVDLAVAFEALGRHAVPGPWIESAGYLPALLDPAEETAAALLARLAEGDIATVAAPPHTPRALDADIATVVVHVHRDGVVRQAAARTLHRSVDPARRLFDVTPGTELTRSRQVRRAYDVAVLACSAQLLGLGEHLLAQAVDYAKTRHQFGRAIGEYQAVKHALADVRVGLDFARPLLHGAALALDGSVALVADGCDDPVARDVSAARVAAGTAAYRAARTALQVHGAIGYTAEYDLGLWLTKVRALQAAWGTPAEHRRRVLAHLEGARQ